MLEIQSVMYGDMVEAYDALIQLERAPGTRMAWAVPQARESQPANGCRLLSRRRHASFLVHARPV